MSGQEGTGARGRPDRDGAAPEGEVAGRDAGGGDASAPAIADPALAALIAGEGADGPARLAFWREVTQGETAPDSAVERRLAQDILAAYGAVPAPDLRAARGPMLSRAASAVRAASAGADASVDAVGDGKVELLARHHGWRGFFGVERLDLRHRRYDGTMSGPLRREIFVMTDAVTVLPYDPLRDRVLMVEQFRAGAYGRGGGRLWQIEAVAGRIDPGETPGEAARREAVEEAGLTLSALLPVAEYYPSPGAATEYLYSFVALTDLPQEGESFHGLAVEGEDIRALTWPFERAVEALRSGLISNAPLILSLLWLTRERARLRGGAGGGGAEAEGADADGP
ncbi:NUDIX domain-containing protein [Pseudogemmobacter sonorensis]|uniref:NUDIX domain-containing protein n=1 Tax=Pseudogemmobacter sonorensis TaxID=2989681 RepID=UPI003686F99E